MTRFMSEPPPQLELPGWDERGPSLEEASDYIYELAIELADIAAMAGLDEVARLFATAAAAAQAASSGGASGQTDATSPPGS